MKKKGKKFVRLTTRETAKAVGISFQLLYNWINAGHVTAPPLSLRWGKAVRLWGAKDVARLREWKRENFNKKVGRPRKKK
jgi:predicted site-specific integrase-resolvase